MVSYLGRSSLSMSHVILAHKYDEKSLCSKILNTVCHYVVSYLTIYVTEPIELLIGTF